GDVRPQLAQILVSEHRLAVNLRLPRIEIRKCLSRIQNGVVERWHRRAVEPCIERAIDIRGRVTELESSRREIERMNGRLPIIDQLVGGRAVAFARISMAGPTL